MYTRSKKGMNLNRIGVNVGQEIKWAFSRQMTQDNILSFFNYF